ncbi:hypothetical protein [Poseidonibacter lekithochrous]|uniref:hypothetical protein n=1 Tax=Poseidonibacter lekithochrous TaxID=1904463 RepID=UPI000D39ADF1|nr:hypothetical protein [Poseidonibacter lekithochrous]
MEENKPKRLREEQKLNMENHIYTYYSQRKQAQDEKWVSSYTTKLKAANFEKLELVVVEMTTSFYDGVSFEDILIGIPVEQKMMVEKLVKVGIRTEWIENCIKEGELAITENREPNYPKFPFL